MPNDDGTLAILGIFLWVFAILPCLLGMLAIITAPTDTEGNVGGVMFLGSVAMLFVGLLCIPHWPQ
jgi:hypothetical protein